MSVTGEYNAVKYTGVMGMQCSEIVLVQFSEMQWSTGVAL